MPLNAGQLDRQITIEYRSSYEQYPTNGGERFVWATYATVWARVVESATAGDQTMNDPVSSYARPTRVTIRYRSDIDNTMRINLGGSRLLQIIGTAEVGRREALQMACREWSHE